MRSGGADRGVPAVAGPGHLRHTDGMQHDELTLTPQQVREIDRRAIEEIGIPGAVLMENAGRNAAQHVLAALAAPAARRVAILCGPGNNGGDGYIVARYLKNAGWSVELFSTVAPERLRGDAAWAAGIARQMGLAAIVPEDGAQVHALTQHWAGCDLLVDALLGTGSSGAPRGLLGAVVAALEEPGLPPVFALDLPTGLDAATGEVSSPCVRAARTLTFVAHKTGFASAAAQAVLGEVHVLDIGVPRELIAAVAAGESPPGGPRPTA